MTGSRTVCAVVTARPSYARIKSALRAITEHPDLELRLVVAASALLERYGQVVNVMRDDGFTPDENVYMVVEGENLVSMAKSTGLGIVELATTFDNIRPDVVLTIADRYETIATAISASYLNIPLAHIQGGEVTGSIDDKVRHAITKLSNLHFVSNDEARERVLRMGEDPASIFVTGCPSVDLAEEVAKDLALDFDPFAKYGGVGPEFDLADGYVVVLQHPVTTEPGRARHDVTETLHAIRSLDVPAFWFWPNVDAGSDEVSKGIRVFRENEDPGRLHFVKNMTPEDFLRLIANSGCVVGNSSVAVRECSYLGVPAVNIGSRQEGRGRGANLVDVDAERDEIEAAVRAQLAHGPYPRETIYGNGDAGQQMAELLATVPLESNKRLTY